MPNSMQDMVKEEYVNKTDWWIRFIVLLVIFLNVLFVREILDIYRTYQMEPAYLIAMVGGLSGGEFSLVYFLTRGKRDMVRESIRYEHDYEMIPMVTEAQAQAHDHLSMEPHKHDYEHDHEGDYSSQEEKFVPASDAGKSFTFDEIFKKEGDS